MGYKKEKEDSKFKKIDKNYLFLIPAIFVVSFSYFHEKNKSKSLVCQTMTYDAKRSTGISPKDKTSLSTKQAVSSKREKEFTNSYLLATPANTKKNTATNQSNKASSFNTFAKKMISRGLIADNSSDMTFQKNHLSESPLLSSALQVGGNYTHINLNPNEGTALHGNLGGAQGSYIYRPAHDLYAGVTLTWSQGNMTGITGSNYLLYIDTQERIGYTFASAQKKWLVSLFSGLGYRHTGFHETPSTEQSVRYRYNEIYVPVGLL